MRRRVINVGTISIIVVFISICLAVLVALSLSSARNDYRLSEKMAKHNTEYYEAVNKMEDKLADIPALRKELGEDSTGAFQIQMNDKQVLEVKIEFLSEDEYELESYKVVNVSDWEKDSSLPVFK